MSSVNQIYNYIFYSFFFNIILYCLSKKIKKRKTLFGRKESNTKIKIPSKCLLRRCRSNHLSCANMNTWQTSFIVENKEVIPTHSGIRTIVSTSSKDWLLLTGWKVHPQLEHFLLLWKGQQHMTILLVNFEDAKRNMGENWTWQAIKIKHTFSWRSIRRFPVTCLLLRRLKSRSKQKFVMHITWKQQVQLDLLQQNFIPRGWVIHVWYIDGFTLIVA